MPSAIKHSFRAQKKKVPGNSDTFVCTEPLNEPSQALGPIFEGEQGLGYPLLLDYFEYEIF
jgi:hypothetical protein